MTENQHTNNERITGLLGPGPSELSCEQCFEALDRCVELALAGVDYEAEVPGMRSHLMGCAACSEEFESVRALAAEEGRL
jgi:hypothetical protein